MEGRLIVAVLTKETFEPYLETEFVAAGPDDARVVLRLAGVRELPHQPGAPRAEPFALLFSGPPQSLLSQATHVLDHAALGRLEIFLVPVGYDASGRVSYEAVFN